MPAHDSMSSDSAVHPRLRNGSCHGPCMDRPPQFDLGLGCAARHEMPIPWQIEIPSSHCRNHLRTPGRSKQTQTGHTADHLQHPTLLHRLSSTIWKRPATCVPPAVARGRLTRSRRRPGCFRPGMAIRVPLSACRQHHQSGTRKHLRHRNWSRKGANAIGRPSVSRH